MANIEELAIDGIQIVVWNGPGWYGSMANSKCECDLIWMRLGYPDLDLSIAKKRADRIGMKNPQLWMEEPRYHPNILIELH